VQVLYVLSEASPGWPFLTQKASTLVSLTKHKVPFIVFYTFDPVPRNRDRRYGGQNCPSRKS
jgi:hypothetical protein